MSKNRLFVAIPIDNQLALSLNDILLKNNIIKEQRFKNKYHITLAFLGDYDIQKVVELLNNFTFNKFIITTNSIKYFLNKYSLKKIYYLGVDITKELEVLYLEIRKKLLKIKDLSLQYTPHITMCRTDEKLSLDIPKYNILVEKIILYNSNLETNKYEIIKEYLLK